MTEQEKADIISEFPMGTHSSSKDDRYAMGYREGFASCLRQVTRIINAYPKKLSASEKMDD